MTTTPSTLLSALRQGGFSVRAAGGKLLIAPGLQLTAELKEGIAQHRDALLSLLGDDLAPDGGRYPDEATLLALEERSWHDPPDFQGGGSCQLRESVILRIPGFPPVALSKEQVEQFDRHLEEQAKWTAQRREQAAQREQQKQARSSKQKKGLFSQ